MRKSLVVLGAVLASALVANATDYSRFETFLGYNLVRFNPNNGFTPSANFNGGDAQFVYNPSKWIGVVADLGAVNKGVIGGYEVDTTVFNYVFGPRFTYHNHSRFTPFVQCLWGGAYGATSAQLTALVPPGGIIPPGIVIPPTTPITLRLNASQNAFAMITGGGLDIKLSKHVAFRPVGFDYYLTRFSNSQLGDNNQNNWRYSAGFNFMFGER